MATRKNSPRKKPAARRGPVKTAAAAPRKAAQRKGRKPPQPALAISAAAAASTTPAVPEPQPVGAHPPAWLTAARAAESKKALDVQVLDLREVTSFADFFVLATGTNPKQVQAIAEEVDIALRKVGEHANSVEGFDNAEWILADYGDFIVHVFSEKARAFYELERLWRAARKVEIPAEA
ncbi:MAG TPA: ribosome silencing factor [Bryobacteraceae bacterium]